MYRVFADDWGRIIKVTCDCDTDPPGVGAAAACGAIDWPDQTAMYVLDGAIAPRPEMAPAWSVDTIPADGVSVAVLSGLPSPTAVRISGPVSSLVNVTSGSLEFTASVVGRYFFTLDAFPYRIADVFIDAT